MKNPGFTIVPVRLFINEKGLAKLVIALAKGKKSMINGNPLRRKTTVEIWQECSSGK